MKNRLNMTKHYLFATDFDQTLSFNDTGVMLSELLGTSGFEEKVAGLAHINMVQQGGGLAYLLLHDPEYRQVRREHLYEVGRRTTSSAPAFGMTPRPEKSDLSSVSRQATEKSQWSMSCKMLYRSARTGSST